MDTNNGETREEFCSWDYRIPDSCAEAARHGSKHQRYRAGNSEYHNRESRRNQNRDRSVYNKLRRELTNFRPFIAWDTEGDNRTATPFLFGSSSGDRLAAPQLSTIEILDAILLREELDPDAIHIIYGGEYDFNMWLKDIPRRCLRELRRTTATRWGPYRIRHIPRKWLIVSRGNISARIFDVVSFFACPYITALEKHGIGTEEERGIIRKGKALRSKFGFEDIAYIERYWKLEIKLLPFLMDKLRANFHKAGCYINSWHGPGALAKMMLNEHRIKECMAEVPQPIHDAARFAFCGGRFESFRAGIHYGKVYNADINSAYPYAIQFLPNLARGRWRYLSSNEISSIDPKRFAIYHIRYYRPNRDKPQFVCDPQPLFRRYSDDSVTWPQSVESWYWSPEAETVFDNPHAEILEGYIFDEDNPNDKPFRWIAEYYDHRQLLKSLGDAAELAFKLGPNSVYGQLAQRAGWEHGIPKYHQIEWAGYVTSTCRAMVYKAAKAAFDRDELISIDTDGIYTTGPIPESDLQNGYGDALGQWKPSNFDGILYWQSGVYWTKEGGNWELTKSRGAPKGEIPFEAAIAALDKLEKIKYTRADFIGYRQALRRHMNGWRYFREHEVVLHFGGAPGSKRYHNPRLCRLCRAFKYNKGFPLSSMHDLQPGFKGYIPDVMSKRHVLPWEDNDHQRKFDWKELRDEEIQTEEVSPEEEVHWQTQIA